MCVAYLEIYIRLIIPNDCRLILHFKLNFEALNEALNKFILCFIFLFILKLNETLVLRKFKNLIRKVLLRHIVFLGFIFI